MKDFFRFIVAILAITLVLSVMVAIVGGALLFVAYLPHLIMDYGEWWMLPFVITLLVLAHYFNTNGIDIINQYIKRRRKGQLGTICNLDMFMGTTKLPLNPFADRNFRNFYDPVLKGSRKPTITQNRIKSPLRTRKPTLNKFPYV